MNPLLHAFRTTFRRFRWEIIVFWLFSAAITAGALSGKITGILPPGSDASYYQPRPSPYGNLEIIAVIALTLRLMFSEPAFLTQGGWRTRPLGRSAVLLAPFAVLAAVVAPAILLRAVPMQALASPDFDGWWRIAKETILPPLGILALIALVMRAAASLFPRSNPGWVKKLGFAVMCLIALAAFYRFSLGTRSYLSSRGSTWIGDGTTSYRQAVLGIQKQLEPGGTYIGDWTTVNPPAPAMRVLYRMPLKKGMATSAPGLRVEITKVAPLKNRLDVSIRFAVSGRGRHQEVMWGVPVLRYAGNSYAFRRNNLLKENPPVVPLCPVWTGEETSRFDSPVGEFWNELGWDELLADAELIVFTTDLNQPPILTIDGLVHPPEKATQPRSTGVASQVEEIFNELDFANERRGDNRRERAAQAALNLPPEAMPHILARPVWSQLNWEKTVKPFLLKYAGEAEKAGLLERMTSDPRLGEIFFAKGWKADAMPLLKESARQRLPLSLNVLKALAEEKDPALAADLAAIAARLPREAGELEPLLKAYPGFDWKDFVRQGWIRRKYAYSEWFPTYPFDYWAARDGDAGAFQFVAEKAARKKQGYDEILPSLVAGEHPDMLGFLRENIARMKFDPASGKWAEP